MPLSSSTACLEHSANSKLDFCCARIAGAVVCLDLAGKYVIMVADLYVLKLPVFEPSHAKLLKFVLYLCIYVYNYGVTAPGAAHVYEMQMGCHF